MKFFTLILLISLTCEAQQDKWKSRAGAVFITFVAALGKEYYDLITGNGVYDKRDIWRTMAGCASITFTFKLKKK